MIKTFSKMTDEELVQQHRQMERIANILHQGIKIGAANHSWEELHERTIQIMLEVEEEFYNRHPEAKDKAIRELLKFADFLIDKNNKELFGDESKAEQHIQLEYNKPKHKKYTVTINYKDTPDSQPEHLEFEFPMYSDLDFLKADLETALDEIAKDLPDVPADK